MRKIILISFLMLMFFYPKVYGSEIIVKSGDCLSVIAKRINCQIPGGYSVDDLAWLNCIPDKMLIFPGQKIYYLGAEDMRLAAAYARRQLLMWGDSDMVYIYYRRVLENIEKGNINFQVPYPTTGTSAVSILQFSLAEKWGQ